MKIDLIDGSAGASSPPSSSPGVSLWWNTTVTHRDHRRQEAGGSVCTRPSTGCYMYYFQYLSKTYRGCNPRDESLGRLINHSKCGNCQTKLHDIDGVGLTSSHRPVTLRPGGASVWIMDRSRASIEAYPWLKH